MIVLFILAVVIILVAISHERNPEKKGTPAGVETSSQL